MIMLEFKLEILKEGGNPCRDETHGGPKAPEDANSFLLHPQGAQGGLSLG